MKRLGLSCHLLLATLFLALAPAASSLRAQDLLSALPPKPKEPPPSPPLSTFAVTLPKPNETLPKEAAAAKQPAAPQRTETARARLMERFDRNKDGRLDADERAEMQKLAKERGVTATPAAREKMAKTAAAAATLRTDLRSRFDRNANGMIDDDEMPAVEESLRGRPAIALLRQRFDRNHDGNVDDAEWKKARPQLQRWLNETPAKAAKK